MDSDSFLSVISTTQWEQGPVTGGGNKPFMESSTELP